MYERPSRHQMRRHVRRMRRYGLQPMTIINPSDPLPETAAVVIARWTWRYRSELAPLATAVAIGAAAWWLHLGLTQRLQGAVCVALHTIEFFRSDGLGNLERSGKTLYLG